MRRTQPLVRELAEFARLMLSLSAAPTGWLMLVFISGVLAISLAGNWLFSLASAPSWTGYLVSPNSVRVLALMAVLIIAAAVFRWLDVRAARPRVHVKYNETQLAPRRKGLVWLLSDSPNVDLPMLALNHHGRSPAGGAGPLAHVWVIQTPEVAGSGRLAALTTHAHEHGLPNLVFHACDIDSGSLEHTHEKVLEIFRTTIAAYGLQPDEVVADITGGTKTMSAGMVLACLIEGYPLEYTTSQFQGGRPVDGTQRVVTIGAEFFSR